MRLPSEAGSEEQSAPYPSFSSLSVCDFHRRLIEEVNFTNYSKFFRVLYGFKISESNSYTVNRIRLNINFCNSIFVISDDRNRFAARNKN